MNRSTQHIMSSSQKAGQILIKFQCDIKISLQHSLYKRSKFEKSVNFSDSKAPIQAIGNNSEDPSEVTDAFNNNYNTFNNTSFS